MSDKETVKVYRVTDRAGVGMYAAASDRNSLWRRAGLSYNSSRHQPIPGEDGIQRTDAHFFAFANAKQMTGWIGDVVDKLDKHGAQVRIFEVPKRHTVFGRKQVAFKKRYARLVGTQPLKEFLKGGNTC